MFCPSFGALKNKKIPVSYYKNSDTLELSKDILGKNGTFQKSFKVYGRVNEPCVSTFCRGKINSLAGRFAAKEAVMKLLGTGVRGVGWKEIEIHRQRGHKPTINLYNKAKNVAIKKRIIDIEISISHSRSTAFAVAVASTE